MERMVKATKNRKWAGMLGGDQRVSWGGMKWKQGVCRAYLTQMRNGKAKKQTTVKKKIKIMGSTEFKVVEKNHKIQTREMITKKRGMESKNTTKRIVLPKIINI